MGRRILIVNVHSSHNAGDAALTMATIGQLRAIFPDCDVTLAMDDPDSHYGDGLAIGSPIQWVKPCTTWRWSQLALLVPATLIPAVTHRLKKRAFYALTPKAWQGLLKAYANADFVVSKPGGFLYSSGRGLSMLVALYTMWLALIFGKPVYMFPQSVGPLLHSWERAAVGGVISKLRIIAVREPFSLSQLRQCGVPSERCNLLPDTAFAFQGASEQDAARWLLEQGVRIGDGPWLGMTTVNWSAQSATFERQEAYERGCAAAIRSFVERHGGSAVLFPQVTGPLPSQDDRVSSRRVARELLDLGDAVHVIESPVSADILRTAYSFMDVFIGTRMHSAIFAMSSGVPTIAIGYQPKTSGIANLVGMERWSIPIEQVDDSVLVMLLNRLWNERESVSQYLKGVIPLLREQAQLPGKMIEDDFTTLVGGLQ